MQTIQMVFGAEVRRRRQTRGWTQEELAARAGTHWTYIGGIERGERNATLKIVAVLTKAFGAEPYELLKPPRGGRGR